MEPPHRTPDGGQRRLGSPVRRCRATRIWRAAVSCMTGQNHSLDNRSSTHVLLRELQEAATHSDRPIADVLRMSLRLASLIEFEQLKEWANLELRGYTTSNVPEYRVLNSRLMADFGGPLGRQLSNVPIPLSAFEEHEHSQLSSVYMLDPVSRVAELVRGADNIGIPLPPARTALLQQQRPILEGWLVSRVWQEVSQASLVAILDQVRTSALEFACELETLFNLTTCDDSGALPTPESITNIFNTTISNPNNAMVGCIGSVAQTNLSVRAGDLDSLIDYLAECNVTDNELGDLRSAIEADRESREQPGNTTKSWIGRMMSKIGTGIASGSGAASGQSIVDAIHRFLGIG